MLVANEKLTGALGQDLSLMDEVGAIDDAERLAKNPKVKEAYLGV